MSIIKKLIVALSLISLMLNLGGCLPFMAARVAKTVSDKTNSPSDADTKKTQDANKPQDASSTPATSASPAAATPAPAK